MVVPLLWQYRASKMQGWSSSGKADVTLEPSSLICDLMHSCSSLTFAFGLNCCTHIIVLIIRSNDS